MNVQRLVCVGRWSILATVLLLLPFGPPLSNACFGAAIPQTVDQLTDNSTHIVRAQVVSTEAQWNAAHTYIYTIVHLDVAEWHKGQGQEAKTITVYVPGGSVNDTTLHVEHAAQFAVGQDVITFLKWNGELYGVTSWEMGKFTVVNERIVEKQLPVRSFVQQIVNAVQR